jgi:hypothetical protein
MHFFGRWGMASLAIGLLILFYGFMMKICDWHGFKLFEEHGPLMAVAFLLLIGGMFFLSTGLIGEMLMRIYFESTNARTYAIKRIFKNAKQQK